MITVFDSLINYNYYQEIAMGCGALCGNNSSVYSPNQYSEKIVHQLLPQLQHAKQYMPDWEYKNFLKQIYSKKQNPLKYRLKVPNKLIPKQQIDPSILTKWKTILYCFDSSNPDFTNCLNYKFKKNMKNEDKKQENLEIGPIEHQSDEDLYVLQQDSLIYMHDQFSQIEKDIDRTCDLPENKKKVFERILKRITNYFPQMGYTQGINFIIGYLLMIGFSEFDAFWMFVHIAIHRRYMQLGLLQDKFPLSLAYNCIFKNVLKRVNTPLYEHFYEELHIDESVWVFKWFITYFIYSFPFQMIKYVFDIVIEMGGIGLIKFAIALTQELSHILLQENDVCEISLFFQSLRNLETFNEYLSINKVVERAYKLEIIKEDFAGIQQHANNFYSNYILANLQIKEISSPNEAGNVKLQVPQQKSKKKVAFALRENTEVNKLLKDWYKKLTKQRQVWLNKKQKQISGEIDNKRTQRISIENELHLLMTEQEDQKSVKSPEKQNSISDNKNSIKDSVQMKKESIPSTGYSFNKKGSEVHNRGDVSQIDELWDEEDRNSSVSKNISSKISQKSRTQNGFNLKVRKASFQDQLDKLASTHCNPLSKQKAHGYNPKTSSIFNQDILSSLKPKINNFQVPSDRTKRISKGSSNLVRAGQQILTNLSINDQSRCESTNSEYSKFSQKQKKSKENDIYGKNYYKTKSKKQISFHDKQTQSKIDESEIKSHDQPDQGSSSRDSYIDPNSFYVSNEFIQEDPKNIKMQAGSVKAFQSHRERMNTHQDMLTISLHASHLKDNNSKQVAESHVSEIEIFQAPQVFKKKNRVSSRISGAQRDNFPDSIKPTKLCHTISDDYKMPRDDKATKRIRMGIEQSSINYEQSYESIFVPSEGKQQNTFRFHQQMQKCEVESVK